ncbi:MAG: helix-turn-helix domain-containing protein [Hyphomonadaceae bacterium]|nr:helix-turn-helix domain-containing protein [Hyphomonadaceae bacterium]
MSMNELLKRIAAEPLPAQGVPGRPSPDLLAMLVRMGRSMRGWKAQTLADFAGVSISTVERVERGEGVSDATLERVGVALGYNPGDFTSERIPLTQEETYASIQKDWGSLVPVTVAPLLKERQLRAMSRCHAILKIGGAFSDDAGFLLDELAEWIDLIGFVRGDVTPADGPKRMRELYQGALECAQRLRREGMNVLAGVWPDARPTIPDFNYAVLAVSPRSLDPGAAKRSHILLDRREVARTPIDWGPG